MLLEGLLCARPVCIFASKTDAMIIPISWVRKLRLRESQPKVMQLLNTVTFSSTSQGPLASLGPLLVPNIGVGSTGSGGRGPS